jgi:hypothetical protein
MASKNIEACAHWLRHRGLSLSGSGGYYEELQDRLLETPESPLGCPSPAAPALQSHVGGAVGDAQERLLTLHVLHHWQHSVDPQDKAFLQQLSL